MASEERKDLPRDRAGWQARLATLQAHRHVTEALQLKLLTENYAPGTLSMVILAYTIAVCRELEEECRWKLEIQTK